MNCECRSKVINRAINAIPWIVIARLIRLIIVEVRHGKHASRAGSRQSFFRYDTNYKIVLCCLHRLYPVVSVIPKEALEGPRLPILLWV